MFFFFFLFILLEKKYLFIRFLSWNINDSQVPLFHAGHAQQLFSFCDCFHFTFSKQTQFINRCKTNLLIKAYYKNSIIFNCVLYYMRKQFPIASMKNVKSSVTR